MRYLDDAETIWESRGDKNVHAEGSGTVDQNVEGNLHVNEDVNRLKVNGNVKGSVHIQGDSDVTITGNIAESVHVHGDSDVTITGNVAESVFVDNSCTVIVEGNVKGNIHGSQQVSVSGRVHGDLLR